MKRDNVRIHDEVRVISELGVIEWRGRLWTAATPEPCPWPAPDWMDGLDHKPRGHFAQCGGWKFSIRTYVHPGDPIKGAPIEHRNAA